ncbi:TIGR03364 family FAD-dependent oxidoreductase [Limnoglobus roseus]|uniref:TIGR03364 family FAD-dependent oxidoreductase n=1 Tax=Limnoglobus roseus TaxID=2598579 RepID=A0A5C1ACC2_9BACT|nr:TIGR03364 family FAD-dependent oxidoreductase [Limnoglobus roseus]QEL15402.1 TIGR03364 family FAD-dependent oxidoreductase [Limnoglobus roseus]
MERRVDVVVVGGGIVGLAFAWEAVRRGKSVAVLERSPKAVGASVRNFGMVWPIGQPAGKLRQLALRSRERWLELRDAAGVWVHECGALHLTHAADEWTVLQEFAAGAGQSCELLSPSDTTQLYPAVNGDGLYGSLASHHELCVEPRQAVDQLAFWLATHHNVEVLFGTAVTAVEMPRVRTAAGDGWTADRVFVCSGADFETLFPTEFAATPLRRCKLQMLRTAPQPAGWRIGPHIAGGLTLAHYAAFAACPTLPALKKRLADEYPEHVRYGIHVMASQNQAGEVVIGDSHEYDDAITPFDNNRIDELILTYLRKLLRLPNPRIDSRWHGVYAKHPTQALFMMQPQPGCHVVASPGGAGMTLSFGFAEDWWDSAAAGAMMTE